MANQLWWTGTNPVSAIGSTPSSGGTATGADWSLLLVRYFLLDYDSGSDTNLGYVDAAAGSTLAPSGLAIKTMEKLYELVPLLGAGRAIVILQKPRAAGANYLDKDGVTQSSIDTSRWSGYRAFLWRGSTDLTNDTTDRVTCGFMVAVAGPGGSSEFTVAAGATSTVVPIAAGTIGAEAATQFRVRFLATTSTVALRNICKLITSCAVNTSVTCGNALPATPAAGDVFVIERPGVRVNRINFNATGISDFWYNTPVNAVIAGVAFTTTDQFGCAFNGGRMAICGVEGPTLTNTSFFVVTLNKANRFQCDDRYQDETSTLRTLGMGMRIQASYNFGGTTSDVVTAMMVRAFGCMNVNQATSTVRVGPGVSFGARSYLAGILTVTGSSAQGQSIIGTYADGINGIIGDAVSANAQPRVVGGGINAAFTVLGPVDLLRLNFEGMGGTVHGCIFFKHIVGGNFVIDGCTSDGTGVFGIDFTLCYGMTIAMGVAIPNTLVGTSGEIRTGGNGIVKHADFTKVGYRDPNGNTLIGSAGLTNGETVVLLNVDGTALALGEVVRGSGTDTVVRARGNTPANCDGDIWVSLGALPNNTAGVFAHMDSPQKWILHNAAPTNHALSYLSTTTSGLGTTTIPIAGAGPLQKLRLGRVVRVSGNLGLVSGAPQLMSVDADGAA